LEAQAAREVLDQILVVGLALVTLPDLVVIPVGVFVPVGYLREMLAHIAPIGNLREVGPLLPRRLLRFPIELVDIVAALVLKLPSGLRRLVFRSEGSW